MTPPGQCMPMSRTKYSVLEHPFRGLPLSSTETQISDVVVLQMTHTNQAGGTKSTKRDVLWVECKAPSKDQPYQWNNVMEEAVARLNVAHPTRSLFLILNVGLEWIMFYWDPINPAPAGQHLRLVDASGRHHWDVDPRMRLVQAAGIQYTVGEDPITNGVIYPDRAKTIDCITTDVSNGQPVLKYQNDLIFLEQCLVHISGANFVGNNDPSFV